MAKTVLWKGVSIHIQSAIAADQVVSSVTKANPGVLEYVGADPSDGDYILVKDVQGMHQINDRVVRVANVNAGANTLELEGVNTTPFDTWVSGNMGVLTLGTSLATITQVNASGGDFDRVDSTTIHDLVRQSEIGLASPLEISMQSKWDPSDPGLVALKQAWEAAARLAMRIRFQNGAEILLYGQVGATGLPTGGAQEIVQTPVQLVANGMATMYPGA